MKTHNQLFEVARPNALQCTERNLKV